MGKKDELAGDLLRGRNLKKKVVPTEQEVAEVAEKVANQESQPQENQSESEVTQTGQPSNTPSQPQEEAPPTPTNEVKKKLIRTTIDLPAYVHKAIKVKAAQEGISLKKYLVSLVKNDLDLK